MARTPPQYAHLVDEPTIIIDPSLYLPPPRSALTVLCDVCIGVTRGVLVAALASATVFSIAHVLKHHSLTHELHERGAPVVVHVKPSEEPLLEQATSHGPAGLGAELRTALASAAGLDEERIDAARMPKAPELPPVVDEAAELMSQIRQGRRLFNARRFDEAAAAFRAVLAVRTNHPAALAGLARVSLARGDVDEAKELAERAVKMAPYQATYHVVLGDVLRGMSDAPGAEAEYELASRLNPEKPIDAVARSLPANPF